MQNIIFDVKYMPLWLWLYIKQGTEPYYTFLQNKKNILCIRRRVLGIIIGL